MLHRGYIFSTLFIIPIFLISGCTKNFQSAIDSVKSAQSLNKTITSDYIRALPYASTLVRLNDNSPVLLILGEANINPDTLAYRLTWLGNDNSSLTTENGRIIHTTGLIGNNLESMQSNASLPSANSKQKWQAIYDWSPGYRYNFSALVTNQYLGTESLITELWTQEAKHVQETINFPSLNSQFDNQFWVVPETQEHKAFVVKSIQYTGPNMDKVEMLMIKPFIEFKQTSAKKLDNDKESS